MNKEINLVEAYILMEVSYPLTLPVNGVEIYKFTAEDSEINATSLCLGNILKDFLVVLWKGLGYRNIDVDEKIEHKIMFIFLMLVVYIIFLYLIYIWT